MNEFMFRSQLDALIEAIKSGDEKTVEALALNLSAQVLLDVHRIANALEKLAGK